MIYFEKLIAWIMIFIVLERYSKHIILECITTKINNPSTLVYSLYDNLMPNSLLINIIIFQSTN